MNNKFTWNSDMVSVIEQTAKRPSDDDVLLDDEELQVTESYYEAEQEPELNWGKQGDR